MTRNTHTCYIIWWDETWTCTNAHHCAPVCPWSCQEPRCMLAWSLSHLGVLVMGHMAVGSMATGSYLPLRPDIILGSLVIILGSLVEHWSRKINSVNVLCTWLWTKGKCQGWVSQTSTDASMEPPSQHAKGGKSSALCLPPQLWCCHELQAEITSSFSPVPPQGKCQGDVKQAGVSGWERDREERELTGKKVSWMLPFERCHNHWYSEHMMLQMSTAYHRIQENLHSFSAAKLFIHKIVFLPCYQVSTGSFCTAWAPLTRFHSCSCSGRIRYLNVKGPCVHISFPSPDRVTIAV